MRFSTFYYFLTGETPKNIVRIKKIMRVTIFTHEKLKSYCSTYYKNIRY